MSSFESVFSHLPEVETKSHGRVNLIGEHTDYNGGYVLPTCIPQVTQVALSRRDDDIVIANSETVKSHAHKDTALVRYKLGEERPSRHWSDYVQGVSKILATDGYKLGGFECWVDSSVPWGSGLSSSAALEVSLLKGLNELFELEIDDLKIARLGQRVENEFVGARVGIMDQMIVSLGRMGEALFIDTRTLSYRPIALPLSEIDLIVINSGVTHDHAQGNYNQRRAECEKSCALLGIKELRDLDISEIDRLESLPETLKRRARHVVTENRRVLEAVSALEKKEFQRLGQLFLESHKSMRDDYQVSVSEIDLLVDLTMSHPKVYGARLTGGGFGGSIVALAHAGQGAEIARQVQVEYSRRTGKRATVLVPEGRTN